MIRQEKSCYLYLVIMPLITLAFHLISLKLLSFYVVASSVDSDIRLVGQTYKASYILPLHLPLTHLLISLLLPFNPTMKLFAAFISSLAIGTTVVHGFPHYALKTRSQYTVQDLIQDQIKRDEWKPRDLIGGLLSPLTGVLQGLDLPTPQDQKLELVPDDKHPYIAPGPSDIRGLCPTMNTMANHGYISRDGITTFAEASNGCQQAFGFSYDLCTFLSGLGLLAGGDLVSGKMSISGPDGRVPNTLGDAKGLDNHGPFEIDGSMTRNDTFFGDNHSFIASRWNKIKALAAQYDNGNFGNAMWKKERKITYDEGVATNPEFYAGAKYIAVSIAERAFIPRALPTFKGGPNPGIPDAFNVEPFFLNETFPDDWFKRGDPYSLVNLAGDVVDYVSDLDTFTKPGQNQGVGNFVPFNVDLPTEPYAAGCFLFTTLSDVGAGGLEGSAVQAIGTFVEQVMAPLFKGAFNCDFSQTQTSTNGSGSGIA